MEAPLLSRYSTMVSVRTARRRVLNYRVPFRSAR
jgi:hypothetical protein